MIVDAHTHLMWYPEHIGQQYAEEALAAKMVKLKYSGGQAFSANLDLHVYDSKPEVITEFTIPFVRVVVFVVISVLAGVLAAVLPAWRASRLDVLDAIATE